VRRGLLVPKGVVGAPKVGKHLDGVKGFLLNELAVVLLQRTGFVPDFQLLECVLQRQENVVVHCGEATLQVEAVALQNTLCAEHPI